MAKRKKRGRSPTVGFRVPEDLKDKFFAIAAERGLDPTTVLKRAVSDYVAGRWRPDFAAPSF